MAARSRTPAFAGVTVRGGIRDSRLTDITDSRDDMMPARRQGSGALRLLLSNEFGLAVLIAIAFTAFALSLEGFTSPFSLFTIGRQIGIDTMIGLAMMAVIVTGGLDLSVGAIGVCAAMVFGWLAQSMGIPLPLAIPFAILFGASLGFINGYAVVRSGVHSFIITLASMSIFFGIMIFLSQAQAFNELPPEVTALGKMRLFGKVSILLVIAIAVCAALSIFYRFTTLGRQMLAAGANPRAAELSGIRTGRVITACHVLTGALAALAGLMLTARTGAAVPSMAGQLGQDWLLPAFLAPVLGGTLLSGGRVSVIGTLLGATFVTIMTSGLLLDARRRVLDSRLPGAHSAARRADRQAAPGRAAQAGADLMKRFFDNDWVGPALVCLVAVVVISILRPSFLSPFNITVLLSAIAVNMVVALGQLVIIAIGQMNLALGAFGGLVAISFVAVMELYGVPPYLAVLIGLAIGTAAGAASGFVIARTGISAFIITLAGLQIFKGINLGITEAQPFYGVPQSVKDFGNLTIFGPIPWLIVPMVIVSVFMWYLFNRMRIGRYILAVGGNRTAAELSGINVTATIIWAFAISGALAAVAGMMLVARLQIGQPTIGDDWLISSFAAPSSAVPFWRAAT